MGPPAPPNSTAIDPHLDHGNGVFSSHSDVDLGPLPPANIRPHCVPFFNDIGNFSHVAQAPSTRTGVSDGYPSLNLNAYPDPWDSQGSVRGISRGATLPLMNPTHTGARGRVLQYDPTASQYYATHSSELDSSVTGRQPPDSGYETRSIYSGELLTSNQDCPSLTGRMDEMELPQEHQQLFREPNTFAVYPQLVQEHQHAHLMSPTVELLQDLKCDVPDCDYLCKNPSDAK